MKKILFSLVLAFCITCIFMSFLAHASPLPGERSFELWFETLNTAAHPVTIKYRTKIDLGLGEEATVVTLFIRDQKTRRIDLETQGNSISVLTVEPVTYIMMHSEAVFEKRESTLVKSPLVGPPINIQKSPKREDYLVSTGTSEINGKSYYYEEMAFDDKGPRTFYYDADTGAWRYWLTRGNLLEIYAYGNEIEDRIFTVPAWYTEIDGL